MSPEKKQKTEGALKPFSSSYYPHEISDKQVAQKYLKDANKPINILKLLSSKASTKESLGKGIVHLFTKDLRIHDNKGLYEASKLKSKLKVPLVGLFVLCTEELYRHSIGGFQLKFILDTLSDLEKNLKKLKIPLVVLSVENKSDYVDLIVDFLKSHQYGILTGNISYEVDELRDFINLHKRQEISFLSFHDTCVVPPGDLASGKGTQYSVFTPWFKAWSKYVDTNKVSNLPEPEENDNAPSHKFEIPAIPEDKKLSKLQSQNYKKLYEPGEEAARNKLTEYLSSDDISKYDENRNMLDEDVGAHLSHYLAIGTISSRTILYEFLQTKGAKKVELVDQSSLQWIRQVAWRDFYKHVVANWPHLVMFRPFHLEFSSLKWEYNQTHYDAWKEGNTGYPIVDACMRQLKQTGYISNRARMIVASFLSKHLLIDWRYGEKYFLELLIDCDFASNNGGWGFSSSTGVDPQPYFRIFNPYIQSERFDPDGEYIRQWVPELKDVKGKAIHQPYEKSSKTINDYPMPIVEHKIARERALERYNEARY